MSPLVKVCGITQESDARFALELGASKLGFILYNKSPRRINFEEILEIKKRLNLQPDKMVAVQVEPTISEIKQIMSIGFGKIQLHFSYDFPVEIVREWSDIIGPDMLWLAPKLPDGVIFPKAILPLAETFLIDAYSKDKFGGTGEISNWDSFSSWQQEFNSKKWVLAGGLFSNNIMSALNSTGAKYVDVNSGVEKAPGIKDPKKLKLFFQKINNL